MTDQPPILGYASSKPQIVPSEFSCHVELRRPAAWPQIVLIAFGLLVMIDALIGILLAAGDRIAREGVSDYLPLLCAAGVILLVLVFTFRLFRELNRLRRAGNQSIKLGVRGTTLLIEDALQNEGSVIDCEIDAIKSFELMQVGITLALQKAWQIQIRRKMGKTRYLRFVADHNSAQQKFELIRQRIFL